MTDPACTCPHEERSLGRLHGVDMGRGIVRTGLTKGCPVHDTCQGYTRAVRSGRPAWSDPWCPIHGRRDCPEGP